MSLGMVAYSGGILSALVPPLWRREMDRRVPAFQTEVLLEAA